MGGGQGQVPAARHRVLGVEGEVDDRRFELPGIGEGGPEAALQLGRDLDILAQGAPQELAHAEDQRVAVDLDRMQRLAAAEGEKALRQFGAALAGRQDRIDQALEIGPRLQRFREDVAIADDDGQQIVEVMGDAAGELADRLHLLRLDQLFLRPLALGQVVDDADEDRFAVLPRLADREVHGKGRTVAAQALDLAADADDLALAAAHVV